MSTAAMTSRPHQHHQHKAPSTAGQGNIKKALRDTLRFLQRPNLPADVRREQERKLQALQGKAVDQAQVEKEKKMVKAYRMVKFFERKKAERKLKQAKNDEAKEAAIMDLNYIIHFPKDRKYIALFPTVETTEEKVLEERRRIRKDINDELVAKAKVSSILEAPLPEMIGESVLAGAGELKARQALNQGHKDSDEDDDEDAGSEDDAEGSDDGSEDNSGSEGSDLGDSMDDSGDDMSDDNEGSDDESGESDDSISDDSDDSNDDEDSEGSGSEDDSMEDSDDDEEDFDSEDDESDNSSTPATKRARK